MVIEYGGINKDVGVWLVSLSTSISERYPSVTCINILAVLLYVCLAWISYCRSSLTNEWVTEDEWEYTRTLVSERMGENTLGRWCQKRWVIEDEWEYMGTFVSERMGDWRWMRIHEDVGVRKDGWEYIRTLVTERMGDWRWMRIHEDVGVRKDEWLKMNENTWGRGCQKGWVIEDEREYMRTLVSERMGDWRWMRIRENVSVTKDGWLKMNENTWGRWCHKGWLIEDEWEYMRTLVSESRISCRHKKLHSHNIMWGFLSFFLCSPDDGYYPAVVTMEVDTHHPSGVWQWT